MKKLIDTNGNLDDDRISRAISWAIDPRDDGPPPISAVYLTVTEVSRALRRSTKYVYRRIRVGALNAVPDGGRFLIHPSALRAYLRRSR